jgi:hypothetical protein
MGVTLYYQGQLRDPQDIAQLIEEVTDIAKASGWKYHVLDDPWDEPVDLTFEDQEGDPAFIGNAGLKGVVLIPHAKADAVDLLFDNEGKLRTVFDMAEPPEDRMGVVSTKTQFAGISAHIQIVHFLEYIGTKYMSSWKLEDESGYARHKNRQRAEQVFQKIGDVMNAVSEAMDTIEIPDDIQDKEKEEEFLAMVEDRIRTYLPGVEVLRGNIHEDEEEEEEKEENVEGVESDELLRDGLEDKMRIRLWLNSLDEEE